MVPDTGWQVLLFLAEVWLVMFLFFMAAGIVAYLIEWLRDHV